MPVPGVTIGQVWNYVLLGGALPASTVLPEPLLQKMRAEFEFWYPFDLRVSGKDLIQNHLSFSLYNHTVSLTMQRCKTTCVLWAYEEQILAPVCYQVCWALSGTVECVVTVYLEVHAELCGW